MASKSGLKPISTKRGLKPMLLALLSEQPTSGYSLQKRLFKHTRPALSQVYRTLLDMQKQGLISYERVPQDKTPDQKVYYITEKGAHELNRWLKQPLSPVLTYDMFIQQVIFSAGLDRKDIINAIARYKKKVKRLRDEFNIVERLRVKKWCNIIKNTDAELFRNLGIDYVVAQLDSWIKWADYAIEKLTEQGTLKRKTKKSR